MEQEGMELMELRDRLESVINQRFGKLIATDQWEMRNNGPYILCRCDCGAEKWIRIYPLVYGRSRSCGVYARSWTVARHTKHGLTNHPVRGVWKAMIARCYNPSNRYFQHYGGRGITVCDRWIGSPQGLLNFMEDMGQRPEGLELERIDNDGNYEPLNCKWATRVDQCNNMRSNRRIYLGGIIKTMAQWCRDLKLNQQTVTSRLNSGWSPEEAFR